MHNSSCSGLRLLMLLPSALAICMWPSTAALISVSTSPASRRAVFMDSSWRPQTVDPLGKAFGVPAARAKSYPLWLDLRSAENTFAQMVVLKLFYAVRRVIDEAGKALPAGAAVEGLLFDEARFDRADTIGQDLPIYLETANGLVNATTPGAEPTTLSAELRVPENVEELRAAQAMLEEPDSGGPAVSTVIALPADALLWSVALTGFSPSELECIEANEGA
uniref:Uncharacterized protein n=1 Tax=Coccolithus braarudii TaxID=221442 RepID=A0A7S0LEC8_9EUKA|mmetsp:Transcript_36159/g.77125  ORF Transcript_36159/g.77125 Transcript_36159/m.77125 type:complete len:221 (+) Transcript_36159:101-763(+)